MSNDDRTTMTETSDGVPEHDAPATESEKHRARVFGELIDGMVDGADPPPALEANHRELLELATSLRAQTHELPLADDRRDELIDAAFRSAIGAADAAPATRPRTAEVEREAGITKLVDHRSRTRRALPWVTTLVAAAAAVFLLVSRPAPQIRTVENVIESPSLEAQHLSRPSDALVGRIHQRDAGDASSRIDLIYADRMAGYRDLHLRGLVKGASQ